MALTAEWRRRIDEWRNELPHHLYLPLGSVELAGFVTKEQLSATEASRREFKPMPVGTFWGMKWEYGWFKCQVVLPKAAAGRRIVLRVDGGDESAIYVNGEYAGAKDFRHNEITLSKDGVPGTPYDILFETYAGHGNRVVNGGPVPRNRETVPEVTAPQAVVKEITFGIWEEEAYQTWVDLETLIQVRDHVDPESLRVSEIDKALREFTLLVDYELSREEIYKSLAAGRKALQPALQCVNGSTAPTMFCFGHAHIDVAWLWPLQETERKCVRTFGTQLALMDEYPEFKFLQSQPHLYRMIKQNYPGLYERIVERVKEGRFIAEGAMWVEPDTNMAGGEALVRQFIHGKRFYREEFGIESEFMWLPDVFGYSGTLPQIMNGCGIKYFATAKITWAYNNLDNFPYNTFLWEGIDGSKVLTHLCNNYASLTTPSELIIRWQERAQKDGFSGRMFPFGYGDGGGGPLRDHIEFLRRQTNLEGVPKAVIATPNEFFHDVEREGEPEARYVGEIYFPSHRGTYTSQAKTKKGNRKSELALREAEMWGVAARALAGFEWPAAEFDELWKVVLLNQFHDILPGSSIARVYEEAEKAYAGVIAAARKTAEQAASKFLNASTGAMTVFNSLSWDRSALVALPEGAQGATIDGVEGLPVQKIGETVFAEVTVPSCGWTTVRPGSPVAAANTLAAAANVLENDLLRVEFNEKGEITSIYDKEKESELAAGLCNSFRMYKDVPDFWDAWDIDSTYVYLPVELNDNATIEVVSAGPLAASLRVTRKLHDSTMTQTITLRRNSRRMDFDTKIEWNERHKLLKVAFPVDIFAHEAIHEIQFGHIKRPNHKSKPYDRDRFEVPNHRWTALAEEGRGFAVLNDCKYGVNVAGNSINLTLLKAPLAPDMHADLGTQEFTYSFYAWNGSLAESDVVREGYDLNVPVVTVAGEGGQGSLFGVDSANVIIETVKPAEDGSKDIVVRLYESKRMATRCTLATSLPVASACETNMLEEMVREVEDIGSCECQSEYSLQFRPFEIKTLRLQVR